MISSFAQPFTPISLAFDSNDCLYECKLDAYPQEDYATHNHWHTTKNYGNIFQQHDDWPSRNPVAMDYLYNPAYDLDQYQASSDDQLFSQHQIEPNPTCDSVNQSSYSSQDFVDDRSVTVKPIDVVSCNITEEQVANCERDAHTKLYLLACPVVTVAHPLSPSLSSVDETTAGEMDSDESYQEDCDDDQIHTKETSKRNNENKFKSNLMKAKIRSSLSKTNRGIKRGKKGHNYPEQRSNRVDPQTRFQACATLLELVGEMKEFGLEYLQSIPGVGSHFEKVDKADSARKKLCGWFKTYNRIIHTLNPSHQTKLYVGIRVGTQKLVIKAHK